MPYMRTHKACITHGCSGTAIRGFYCDECYSIQSAMKAQSELRRPKQLYRKTAERGYDARWQRYSKRYLVLNPYCCKCGDRSTKTDHIIPHKGPGDPNFWNPLNHQPMCARCHGRKSGREGGRGVKSFRDKP